MRRIFIVLLVIGVLGFWSCDDNEDKPNYLDNRLIYGTWSGKIDDVDSLVYVFDDKGAIYKYYAKVLQLDTLKLSDEYNYGPYLLTDTSVVFTTDPAHNFTCKFYFDKDSIFINDQRAYLGGLGLKRVAK